MTAIYVHACMYVKHANPLLHLCEYKAATDSLATLHMYTHVRIGCSKESFCTPKDTVCWVLTGILFRATCHSSWEADWVSGLVLELIRQPYKRKKRGGVGEGEGRKGEREGRKGEREGREKREETERRRAKSTGREKHDTMILCLVHSMVK